MGLTKGNKINPNDIIQTFTENLVNQILSYRISGQRYPMLHSGYQPGARRPFVPASYLGSIPNIPTPNIGNIGNVIQAKKDKNGTVDENYNINLSTGAIYNALLYVTRYLLMVGTWSYYEYCRCTGYSYSRKNEVSYVGTALFTPEYACRSLNINGGSSALNSFMSKAKFKSEASGSNVDDKGVAVTRTITVSNLNSFINNLFIEWKNSTKPSHYQVYEYCHGSCHNNCHHNCHSSCHTESSSGGGGGGGRCHNACYSNKGHYSECHSGFCYGD